MAVVLTGDCIESIHFVSHDDDADGDCREEIDQEWQKRIDKEKQQVQTHPDRLIGYRIVEYANRPLPISDKRKGFVENQFINVGDQNSGKHDCNQTTSNAWLSQPSTIERKSHVDTFNRNQGG